MLSLGSRRVGGPADAGPLLISPAAVVAAITDRLFLSVYANHYKNWHFQIGFSF